MSCTSYYVCDYVTHTMPQRKTSEVQRWFVQAVQGLWPMATGSLSLRKSPCIRTNCKACASGQGHSSYVLYSRRGKRRFSIYIPDRLVPEVRAAIDNGHLMQELLNEAAVRYVNALKEKQSENKRKRAVGPATR